MGSNSSTIAVPSEVRDDDLTPTSERRRGLVGWAVVFAGCLAVATLAIVAWIGGGADRSTRTVSVYPNEARRELETELRERARTYQAERRELETQAGTVRPDRIVISADAAERAAQGSTDDETGFLEGSRRVPTK